MPSLPQKSIKGAAFKKWVVESIDKLIDYLSSTYIQVGQGLKINRTPSGLVIELEKPAKVTQNNTTGDGGSPSVSGMTYPDWAAVSSSGSLSLNSPITLQYNAWIYVTGVWESIATGRQLSYLNIKFTDANNTTQSYRISAFRSINSEETDYFSLFIPAKSGLTCELVPSVSTTVHTLSIVESGIYYYQS